MNVEIATIIEWEALRHVEGVLKISKEKFTVDLNRSIYPSCSFVFVL